MTNQQTAVVLGLFDTGLGVVRSLARMGIPVLGLDSNSDLCGFASRLCRPRLCPDPIHEPDALLTYLLDDGLVKAPAVLFPATDAFFMFLSRYRQELSGRYLFLLPPDAIIEGMIDKRKQYDLAKAAGIPIADTFYPETLSDVNAIKGQLQYPALIKPYVGHLWRDRLQTQSKGFKVFNGEELINRYREVFSADLLAMVQSIIPGPNTNHFKVNVYIGKQGDLQALFTLRKIRQFPKEFGVGSCVESIHDDALAKLGLDFFERIQYRGVGSIEFKRDERDGRLKMIELNPRFWQQNSLATDCGLNFSYIAYKDLIGQPLLSTGTFKVGVKWLDLLLDWYSFQEYAQHGELSLGRWLLSWKGVRSFPVFALDDPGPFFRKYRPFGRVLKFMQRSVD